jgi:hypothetical protein
MALKWSPLSRWRDLFLHLAVLGFVVILAVVVTFPLIGRLRHHLVKVIGANDPVCFAWNNWWIYHALVNLHGKPYFTDFLLVPFPLDLRLHTLGLFYGVVSVPFVPLLGPVAVVNLQIFVTVMLNGYAVFLLVRKWVGRADVALVCGGALAICPAIAFHLASGRPSCAAIWPLALAQLFLMRLIEEPRWRNCLGFAGFLVVLLAVDQQMPIFGGMFFFLYLAGVAATRPDRLFNRRMFGYGLAVLVLVAYPIRILYVRPFFQTPGYTVPHPSEALVYSFSLGFLLNPRNYWGVFGFLLPLGLVTAVAVVRRERRAVFGIACAILGLSLTLGPVIRGTHIPMPFALLRRLPGLSMFRAPYRFQILAALGMTIALAVGLTHLLSRLLPDRRLARSVLAGLALLVLCDAVVHRSIYGFATHAIQVEPIYQRIAQTPGDFLVLEIPVGVRSGTDVIGRGDDLMLYQTVHGKRLINGYLSRVPLVALDYYRKSPALMFLANERPPPGDVAADLEARMRALHVGFVLVHPEMLDRERFQAIRALLGRRTDLEPVPTGTTTLAFRVAGAI